MGVHIEKKELEEKCLFLKADSLKEGDLRM